MVADGQHLRWRGVHRGDWVMARGSSRRGLQGGWEGWSNDRVSVGDAAHGRGRGGGGGDRSGIKFH
jgi:hypothetical protein